MCDRIVVLARLDHRRWISCCEHGTTHLAWDSVSVRIPLQRLGAMSHALQECSLVARRFRIASTGEVCIVFDQHDLYQVWFAGVGLCLSPNEFELFCQMVSEAGEHPLSRSSCDEAELPTVEAPIRTTFHLFSLN
jgi:hypothetical protein